MAIANPAVKGSEVLRWLSNCVHWEVFDPLSGLYRDLVAEMQKERPNPDGVLIKINRAYNRARSALLNFSRRTQTELLSLREYRHWLDKDKRFFEVFDNLRGATELDIAGQIAALEISDDYHEKMPDATP
ncbi:MAG: hypothetical protein ACR2H9_07685 [Longimicrobiaceae bacterium]